MVYTGRCHCGSIGFSFVTERPPPDWPIRACQCSFCRAHGVRTTSDPAGSVEFALARADRLQQYRFGHGITDFLLCRDCGVYLGATTRATGVLLAIVNVNALHPRPQGLNEPVPVAYDDEGIEARSSRRKRSWTPCLGISVRSGAAERS